MIGGELCRLGAEPIPIFAATWEDWGGLLFQGFSRGTLVNRGLRGAHVDSCETECVWGIVN